MISESDWKTFKKIKEAALERFCAAAVAAYAEAISAPGLTNQEKHLRLTQLALDYDKHLARLFDDHSRSKASFQLFLLRAEELVSDEELASLSDELKAATKPKIPAS